MLLISDANILIDMESSEILERLFRLPILCGTESIIAVRYQIATLCAMNIQKGF
jgi:hypothetical protein